MCTLQSTATKEQKIQHLEQVTQEKDRDIEAGKSQIRDLNQKLTESEQLTAQFQQDLQQRENMIQDLQEEKQQLRQELAKVSQQQIVTLKDKLTLSFCIFYQCIYALSIEVKK